VGGEKGSQEDFQGEKGCGGGVRTRGDRGTKVNDFGGKKSSGEGGKKIERGKESLLEKKEKFHWDRDPVSKITCGGEHPT